MIKMIIRSLFNIVSNAFLLLSKHQQNFFVPLESQYDHYTLSSRKHPDTFEFGCEFVEIIENVYEF